MNLCWPLNLRIFGRDTEAPAPGPFGDHATLADDLVSYWKLDEVSGVRYDSHGSNDLTDNNTVGSVNQGPRGTVADFEADNTESLTKTSVGAHSGTFTWAGWIKRESIVDTVAYVAKWASFPNGVEYLIYVTGGGNNLQLHVGDGSASSAATATAFNATAGEWVFVAAWLDTDKKPRIQINDGAVNVGTALAGTPAAASSTLYLGHGASVVTPADGLMGRWGYWNGVVSTAALTSLYNSGNGKSYSDLTDDEKVGLVSYWNLDETSGTRYDSHGTNHLTDNNTVTSVVNAGGAMKNVAAYFTLANSESLSVADTATLDFANDVTISAWANITAQADGSPQQVVTKIAAGENGWALGFETGRWRFSSVGVNDANDGGVGVTDGMWYHLIGWRTAGQLFLQVNGIEYSGAASALDFSNTGPFRIGARNATATEFFGGKIDEVGVWSRVLTAQERTDLFNAGNGLFYGD